MKTTLIVCIGTLFLAAVVTIHPSTARAAADSPSELLEKGIYNEETKGDLDSAITIYQQLIAESDVNRSLAAEAQFRLGQCYLKKGRTLDANAAFEKLIHDFPNEKELVAKARLSRLIENFLTFSRLERNKFKFQFANIQPQQIVEGAVAAMGERSALVETRMAENLPAIRGDADALVTALLNLLDNAWKYSGDEKHIVVRAEVRSGNVCFRVEDNGIGLSPSKAKRVFRRFYQTDQRLARVASGCGLGLSIVQSIVEAHHGVVRVASEPGRGSTFTIEIPTV